MIRLADAINNVPVAEITSNFCVVFMSKYEVQSDVGCPVGMDDVCEHIAY